MELRSCFMHGDYTGKDDCPKCQPAASAPAPLPSADGGILRAELAAARDKAHASECVLSMAVARLGGIVEGHPTGRHNFLQRIDELRRIEEAIESPALPEEDADVDLRICVCGHAFTIHAIIEDREGFKVPYGACSACPCKHANLDRDRMIREDERRKLLHQTQVCDHPRSQLARYYVVRECLECLRRFIAHDSCPVPTSGTAALTDRIQKALSRDYASEYPNGLARLYRVALDYETLLRDILSALQAPAESESSHATIEKMKYALTQCYELARREARKEQAADNSRSSRWNHIIRFCKDADEDGTITSGNGILREGTR